MTYVTVRALISSITEGTVLGKFGSLPAKFREVESADEGNPGRSRTFRIRSMGRGRPIEGAGCVPSTARNDILVGFFYRYDAGTPAELDRAINDDYERWSKRMLDEVLWDRPASTLEVFERAGDEFFPGQDSDVASDDVIEGVWVEYPLSATHYI